MRKNSRLLQWAGVAALFFTFSCGQHELSPDNSSRTIDAASVSAAGTGTAQDPYTAQIGSTAYQTIKGFGIFPAFPNYYERLWKDQGQDILTSNAIQTALYTDLGIEVMRVEIHPNYYNDNGVLNTTLLDQTLVLHIQKARAKNPNIKYITTVWSPRAAWKTCNTTAGRCGDPDATPVVPNRLKPEFEDETIKAAADVIKYLAGKGLGLPAGHCLQNELTSAVKWDGAVYTEEQYHRVIKAMRTYFNNNGLSSVPLMGPEGGTTAASYNMLGGTSLSYLNSFPALNAAINILTAHTYDQFNDVQPSVTDLKNFGTNAKNTGKERWMTEWCTTFPVTSTNATDQLINEIEHFSRDLVLGQYNYWFYWLGWRKRDPNLGDDGQMLLYGLNPDSPIKTKRYHVYQRLFRSVTPGSVVKHFTTDDPSLKADNALEIDLVAFDRGVTTVVLLINPTSADRYLNITGLEGSFFRRYQSTATANMNTEVTPTDNRITNGTRLLQLPAKSIVVLDTYN